MRWLEIGIVRCQLDTILGSYVLDQASFLPVALQSRVVEGELELGLREVGCGRRQPIYFENGGSSACPFETPFDWTAEGTDGAAPVEEWIWIGIREGLGLKRFMSCQRSRQRCGPVRTGPQMPRRPLGGCAPSCPVVVVALAGQAAIRISAWQTRSQIGCVCPTAIRHPHCGGSCKKKTARDEAPDIRHLPWDIIHK